MFSVGVHRPEPGFEPDETRPLRSEPVRREEVMINDREQLLTMPIGTFRFEHRELEAHPRSGPPFRYTEDWLIGDAAL